MLEKSELFSGQKCRFKNRIIFPIKNHKGHVVAFGGRLFGDSYGPKYLNSKETELFKKREILYGFSEASKTKKFLITEGYLDVIKVDQIGKFSAVAPLGTSFSKEQADQIWIYDEMPLVCFDGDLAGQNASYRLIDKMLPYLTAQKSFAFLDLPNGEDADSYSMDLSKLTPISFADKLFEKLCLTKKLSIPEHQAFVKEEIIKVTNTLQNKALGSSFRQYLLGKLWEKTKHKKAFHKQHITIPPLSKAHYVEILARIMLATLVKYPDLLEEVQEYLGRMNFEDIRFETLKNKLLERYFDDTVTLQSDFLDMDKLISYAPFLKGTLEKEEAKNIWMDIWQHYLGQQTQKSQTWEDLKASKKNLVVGQDTP